MTFAALPKASSDPLSLIAQIPLQRDDPIETLHPLLARNVDQLEDKVQLMWETGAVQKLVLAQASEVFHIFLVPSGERTGHLLVWDMSPVERLRRRYHETVIHTYRDVLYAATEGRLLVVDPVEIGDLIGEPIWEAGHPIRVPADIGACRSLVMSALREAGDQPGRVLEFALAVSEAASNALQHSAGGEFRLLRAASGWTAMVSDQAAGMDLAMLPHATLLRGYSTKVSLGIGYTAMLRCMDRVVIATSSSGTTVLLQRFAASHAEEVEAIAQPVVDARSSS